MNETITPPTKTNSEIKIKEMELEVLKSFLSSDKQKTQITIDERVLISVLDEFADNPYPISQNFCKVHGIPFEGEGFKMDFLKTFLNNFLLYGIPLGRQGRTEEVKVLSSYFEAQREEKRDEEAKNTMTSKLMK